MLVEHSRTITMQGFIILPIAGTEKLIVTEVDGRTDGVTDGWTDRNLNSYIAPCFKQMR